MPFWHIINSVIVDMLREGQDPPLQSILHNKAQVEVIVA
jgi:hypothetical protein